MTPSRLSLRAIIERCGLSLEADQYDRLWAYHGMLRAANAELNLTRIHNFENMVLKHYVDSLLVLTFEDLPAPLVDMGSGAGLPGVPLKIARPDVPMILAEPRKARAEFLEQVCLELGLEEIEVYAGKVGPRFPRSVRGVITRAVSSIPETLDRVADALEPGGRMLFMKGPECDAEIKRAEVTHGRTFRHVADHRYNIPDTPHERRLVVYERTDAPSERPTSQVHSGPVREVTSVTNPTFRLGKDLLTGRGIRKHGKAILAGQRPIAEVLERYPDRVDAWITDSNGSAAAGRVVDLVSACRCPLQGTRHRGHAVAAVAGERPRDARVVPGRALAGGLHAVRPLSGPGERRGRPAVVGGVRGGAGGPAPRGGPSVPSKGLPRGGPALFQVPLLRGPSIHDLDPSALPLLALSSDGEDVSTAPWPERFGLVPGLEGPGLPEPLRSGTGRRIPIADGVESLNAATATAVALYAWRQSSRS